MILSKFKFSFQRLIRYLYLISLVILLYFSYHGWDYYRTPLVERPRHGGYTSLKPGGMTGHGFGVIGGVMILLTYVYTARKRWKPIKKIGSIPQWLDVHIYFGLTGPALIILHTSFKIYGLIAIAFWAMIAVVLSGFVGRFLIRQIPRNIKGQQLSLAEIQAQREIHREQMQNEYGLTPSAIEAIEAAASQGLNSDIRFFGFVWQIFRSDLNCRFRVRRLIREDAYSGSPKNIKMLIDLACEESILTRKIQVLKTSQKFFKHWHRIHKPFSVILLIIMFIHITVAVIFGYRWVF